MFRGRANERNDFGFVVYTVLECSAGALIYLTSAGPCTKVAASVRSKEAGVSFALYPWCPFGMTGH